MSAQGPLIATAASYHSKDSLPGQQYVSEPTWRDPQCAWALPRTTGAQRSFVEAYAWLLAVELSIKIVWVARNVVLKCRVQI